MRCIIKVFCKAVCLVFVMEGSFVLFVPREKSPTNLSDVRFLQSGQESLYAPDSEYMYRGVFVCE